MKGSTGKNPKLQHPIFINVAAFAKNMYTGYTYESVIHGNNLRCDVVYLLFDHQ